jgi:hypothetical protein
MFFGHEKDSAKDETLRSLGAGHHDQRIGGEKFNSRAVERLSDSPLRRFHFCP